MTTKGKQGICRVCEEKCWVRAYGTTPGNTRDLCRVCAIDVLNECFRVLGPDGVHGVMVQLRDFPPTTKG